MFSKANIVEKTNVFCDSELQIVEKTIVIRDSELKIVEKNNVSRHFEPPIVLSSTVRVLCWGNFGNSWFVTLSVKNNSYLH